jgi:hypothetical protein
VTDLRVLFTFFSCRKLHSVISLNEIRVCVIIEILLSKNADPSKKVSSIRVNDLIMLVFIFSASITFYVYLIIGYAGYVGNYRNLNGIAFRSRFLYV